MAKAGWSETELDLLRKEIELAKAEAQTDSFRSGDTLSDQKRKVAAAEKRAREVAHDRFHAKIAAMTSEINRMAAWKKAHPDGIYDPDAREESEKVVASMPGRHLGRNN